MNVQLKTVFRIFISFIVDCRNTLSYLQEVFQPAAVTCQEPRSRLLTSCCSLQLYSQPWVVTLHFLMPSFNFHCFKHCNMVTMSGGFYLSLTSAVVSLSQLRTPLFPHTHTHALSAWKTNTFMSYCICETKSLSTPPRFSQLTVKFWVNWAGGSSHPSCILTHVTNEKRDKRDFHIKGWRAHLQFLKQLAALGSPEYRHRDTHMHTFGTHKKKPFFNDLICCIFHGSHQHLFCVRSHYPFPPPSDQLHSVQYALRSVYVPNQCSVAEPRSRQFCSV